MSKLNLVTVVGHDTGILKHMLKYYEGFVDNIYIVAYLNNENDYILDRIEEAGHTPYKTIVAEKFHWRNVTNIYNAVKLLHPEDWWIVADVDEFQVYSKPVQDLIAECENTDKKFVTGGFLDRIGPDGSFSEIDNTNIWTQFPLGGFFRYPLSGACPNKVTLMKGFIQVTDGQHYAKIKDRVVWGPDNIQHPWRYPVQECFTQVHHFKWDSSVLKRLKEVSETKHSHSYSDEYRKMYHSLRRGNKLDITKKEFGFEEISSYYNDYTNWKTLTNTIINI